MHAGAPRSWRGPTTAVLVFLFTLVVVLPLTAAQPGAQAMAEGDRIVLVLVGEETGRTTVLQRLIIDEAARRHGAVRLAVPHDAAMHTVSDPDGAPLSWTEPRSGTLTIGIPNGTETIDVASRGVRGPTVDEPLRFGSDTQDGRVWLVVVLPAGAEGTPHDLARVSRNEITDAIPAAAAWPIPPDAETYWNAGAATTLPTTLRLDPRAGASPLASYGVAAGLGIVLALLTLWLVVRIHRGADDPTRTRRQPIMAHLNELRRRATIVLIVLAAAMTFFFTFAFRWVQVAGFSLPVPWPSLYGNSAAQAFEWISRRIVPPGVELVVVTPWDAVVTLLLLSIVMGVLATFPILFYHVYAFLAPALYPPERRLVLSLVPLVVILLILGASFGFAIMAPLMARILYGFAGGVGATALLTMSQLVGLAALMTVIFAVSFQLPLVMMATARMGLVRARWYREKWRHAVIVIALVAAFITDPTVLTQIIVGAVLFALYCLGIVLAMLVDRERTPRAG